MKPQEVLPLFILYGITLALGQQYQQPHLHHGEQHFQGQQNHQQATQEQAQPAPGQPIHHRQHPPTEGAHRFKEGARDRNHVMDHLDGVVQNKQEEKMSEDEVQFHYFKLHDYDDNNKLDGIELVSALTHYHKDEDPNDSSVLEDEELKNLVDTILKEDDRNNDGYIDYAEFILSQRT